MKFQYEKLPQQPPSPVDGAKHKFRPMVPIEIEISGRAEWWAGLIDSGADFNMAPLEIAEYYEIDINDYPQLEVRGIDREGGIKLGLVPIKMKFGGHLIETIVGIGGKIPYILLGQKGFFDKVKQVSFHYPKYVEIKI